MTLFEALTGGAFDRLNWQHSGELDQNFSKKSNAPGVARGGIGGFEIDRYIAVEPKTLSTQFARSVQSARSAVCMVCVLEWPMSRFPKSMSGLWEMRFLPTQLGQFGPFLHLRT